jgi:RNA recognition motif-containing protein
VCQSVFVVFFVIFFENCLFLLMLRDIIYQRTIKWCVLHKRKEQRRMNIYVANLPYSINRDQLKEIFAPFGDVSSARVVTDRETGRSKGFGFVEMPDNTQAQAAVDALNGSEVGGRKVVVNEARPRQPKP